VPPRPKPAGTRRRGAPAFFEGEIFSGRCGFSRMGEPGQGLSDRIFFEARFVQEPRPSLSCQGGSGAFPSGIPRLPGLLPRPPDIVASGHQGRSRRAFPNKACRSGRFNEERKRGLVPYPRPRRHSRRKGAALDGQKKASRICWAQGIRSRSALDLIFKALGRA